MVLASLVLLLDRLAEMSMAIRFFMLLLLLLLLPILFMVMVSVEYLVDLPFDLLFQFMEQSVHVHGVDKNGGEGEEVGSRCRSNNRECQKPLSKGTGTSCCYKK